MTAKKPPYPLNPHQPDNHNYTPLSHITVANLASLTESTPQAIQKILTTTLAPAVIPNTSPTRLLLSHALQLWSRISTNQNLQRLRTAFPYDSAQTPSTAPPTPSTPAPLPTTLHPPLSGDLEDDDITRFNKAKADKEEHLAVKASIEVSTMQLQTINLQAAEAVLFSVTREARNILLGIPAKIADALASEQDVFKVKRILIEAIEDALMSLGDSDRVMAAIKDASLALLDGKMKKSVGGVNE